MKYINKFKLTSEFEAAKEQLQELEHYVAYDAQTDKIYLKMPTKSYTLHYKITKEVISMASNFGNKLPLITRCDLFKSIKVNDVEQDLSRKVRTPYEFKKETYDEIKEEFLPILFTFSEEGRLNGINEEYVLTTSELIDGKEGTIEVVWQDNIPLKSFIDCMYYNMCITSIPNDMFINKQFINLFGMFGSCASLTSLDVSSFKTSNVTNMSEMFYGCASLTSLDLSNFDTSQVTDMIEMFANCTSLTSLDLSNFDARQDTEMIGMFYNCNSLTHIKCKQLFKDWCITNQSTIDLPTAMREGGNGKWEIVD